MNGWWFAAGCVGLYLLFAIFAARANKRQVAALAKSRVNPGREEFVALLMDDCDPDIAEFLWTIFTEEYSHWGVELSPHPDDNYLEDMPIDPDNQGDWLSDFCAANDLSPKDMPHWPDGWETTVRNFARWLQRCGRR
ncbi:hypothetical protein [Sphingopyxis sp. DBS4]|uniref:hypothetical protein n=1 Tax=Sphingopyxis sp. DBS4 TaxID=2968500 RepID=UPI00214BD5D0|nr:hypothetical protein [Sphingopyxis sp. DBS4]